MDTRETVREDAGKLLAAIGVSRIIVVDDQYADDPFGVEDLVGVCAELGSARAAELPSLDGIDFGIDPGILANLVRDRWAELGDTERTNLRRRAHALAAEAQPSPMGSQSNLKDSVDSTAAESLEDILDELPECEFMALPLSQWRLRSTELLADAKAATTVFLFDRDFSQEESGADDHGFTLVREVQATNIGYCGLITHTVQPGDEYARWNAFATEYGLVRERFVVIAKQRLSGDPSDCYGFLGMLRLVALSERYTHAKSAAWCSFEESLDEAREAIEALSVLDFDKIVFGSSHREGVWEPDTLFRVFGILMRRGARARLRQAEDFSGAFADARRVSAMPEEIKAALDEERFSPEALRIQRFECYESADDLNQFHVPIELGDIFERDEQRYVLLGQPCDLMVRKDGRRSYDDKCGLTGSLVELVVDYDEKKTKDSWKELPFYDQYTGRPAFANFSSVHQVLLAVLDLCVLQKDGAATIDLDATSPELVIEAWRKRHNLLRRFFHTALTRYKQLEQKGVKKELRSLALRTPSTTLRLPTRVDSKTLQYGLRRVMRLRQPWSGAMLTAYTHYQARAAFEHPLDHRIPT